MSKSFWLGLFIVGTLLILAIGVFLIGDRQPGRDVGEGRAQIIALKNPLVGGGDEQAAGDGGGGRVR